MKSFSHFRTKGNFEPVRRKETTQYPSFDKYSHKAAPLAPEEKLSKNLTAIGGFSNGAEVPPDVMNAIFLFPFRRCSWCLEKKSSRDCLMASTFDGSGVSAKNWSHFRTISLASSSCFFLFFDEGDMCVWVCGCFEAFVTNTVFLVLVQVPVLQTIHFSVFFHSQPVYTRSKSWRASIESRSRSIRGTKDRIFRNVNLIETRAISFQRLYLRFRHCHHALVHKHDS